MKKLQERTKPIEDMFRKLRERKWTPEVIMVDLMEEVGELANAVLVREKFKSEKRKKSDLRDCFGDVLMDLIFLANYYEIDIEEEYNKILE